MKPDFVVPIVCLIAFAFLLVVSERLTEIRTWCEEAERFKIGKEWYACIPERDLIK